MAVTSAPVTSSAPTDPESFLDLVDDCREVASVLAPYVIDLTRVPAVAHRPAFPIPAQTAARLDGYDSYGS